MTIEQAILIDAPSGKLLIEDVNNNVETFDIQDIYVAVIRITGEIIGESKEVEVKENGITTTWKYGIPEYKEVVMIVGSFLMRKSEDLKGKEIGKTIIRIIDGYVAKCSNDPSPFYNRNEGIELLHCKFTSAKDETPTLRKIEFDCNELYYIREEEQEELTELLLK